MRINRRVLLVERPRYIVPTANCFKLDQAAVPEPGAGQLLIRTTWLALDVMLYARVKRITADAEPVTLRNVMAGATLGRVEVSNHPDYVVGDLVRGFWGWQDYAVSDGQRLRKVDFCVTPSHALGAYGSSGFGAYIALEKLAVPTAGETVVVGTAVGGLGQIAGQIAKLKGCRVVGIAGGSEKCEMAVQKLGFDACIDHKASNFATQLAAACPKGVDVFIDTIGGKVLDAVVAIANRNARIAACGLMSTPHFGDETFAGRYASTISFVNEIINRRLQVRGLVVFDHINRDTIATFDREMSAWIASGQVKPLEDIVVGLENAPVAFQGLFEGRNKGKLLVKIAD